VCRRAARSGTGLPTAARNPFGAHFYPTGTPENQRRADLLLERKMLHAKARPRCTALGSEDRRRSACRHGWASVAMGSGTRLALKKQAASIRRVDNSSPNSAETYVHADAL